MKTIKHINEGAVRAREDYRCPHCGRFISHDTNGFFDRENRDDETSAVLVFCSEEHANRYHDRKCVACGATVRSEAVLNSEHPLCNRCLS